jgi:hypothetical protein
MQIIACNAGGHKTRPYRVDDHGRGHMGMAARCSIRFCNLTTLWAKARRYSYKAPFWGLFGSPRSGLGKRSAGL